MTHERFGQFTIDSSDNSEFYLEVSEHDDGEEILRNAMDHRKGERSPIVNKNAQDYDGDHFVMHSVDTAFKEHRFTVARLEHGV